MVPCSDEVRHTTDEILAKIRRCRRAVCPGPIHTNPQLQLQDSLRENVQDHQKQLNSIQEEAARARRTLEAELNELQKDYNETLIRIERVTERKNDLKGTVHELQTKLNSAERQNESLGERWKERCSLLDRLETQLAQMREEWHAEQTKIMKQRDAAQLRIKDLLMQMERMEVAFREQMCKAEASKNTILSAADAKIRAVEEDCAVKVAKVPVIIVIFPFYTLSL
ncbi:unnamed protein product [Protopolystoma xenopodis]|uniref:Uncharacterized protein n=1 Tax=Protopolystoma xenopodis TaxID=117903 RepID=A0A3S5BKV3_9PLAT|nr:unnamed protein product [Protopolystoma xenopodis]